MSDSQIWEAIDQIRCAIISVKEGFDKIDAEKAFEVLSEEREYLVKCLKELDALI